MTIKVSDYKHISKALAICGAVSDDKRPIETWTAIDEQGIMRSFKVKHYAKSAGVRFIFEEE